MLLSAFSMGSSRQFAIAVTEGLLRRLTMREVAAVLAREVAHAQRGDLLVLGIADWISRFAQAGYYVGLALAGLNILRGISGGEAVSWLSVALLILAPALMTLLQLALSSAREIDADRAAALLTGDSLGVASAVSRLDPSPGSPLDDLMPPVPARKVPLPSMLRYPPPSDRRIARLNAFQAPPMPPLDIAEGPAHLADRGRSYRDAAALSMARRLVLMSASAAVSGDEAAGRACAVLAFAPICRYG